MSRFVFALFFDVAAQFAQAIHQNNHQAIFEDRIFQNTADAQGKFAVQQAEDADEDVAKRQTQDAAMPSPGGEPAKVQLLVFLRCVFRLVRCIGNIGCLIYRRGDLLGFGLRSGAGFFLFHRRYTSFLRG